MTRSMISVSNVSPSAAHLQAVSLPRCPWSRGTLQAMAAEIDELRAQLGLEPLSAPEPLMSASDDATEAPPSLLFSVTQDTLASRGVT